VIGFLATVAPEKFASQNLTAAASGVRTTDFAVRVRMPFVKAHPRPPHPHRAFVTIASRPLVG
jgi:hypothetical protein